MFDEYHTTITLDFEPQEIQYLESKIKREIESEEDLYDVIKSLIGLGD